MVKFVLSLIVGILIIEVATFIQFGGYLGLWPTICAAIFTAILGAALLRKQGVETFFSAHESLRQNRIPVNQILDGLFIVFAGVLLLIPGFITDFVGLMLFTPWIRMCFRNLFI